MLKCTITHDEYNKNVSALFRHHLSTLFTSSNADEIITFIKNWLISNVINLKMAYPSLEIDGVSIDTIIQILISTIEIRPYMDSKSKIEGYEIGWFTQPSARFATILEFGTQSGNDNIPASSIIAKLLRSQESDSFVVNLKPLIESSLREIINKLGV